MLERSSNVKGVIFSLFAVYCLALDQLLHGGYTFYSITEGDGLKCWKWSTNTISPTKKNSCEIMMVNFLVLSAKKLLAYFIQNSKRMRVSRKNMVLESFSSNRLYLPSKTAFNVTTPG